MTPDGRAITRSTRPSGPSASHQVGSTAPVPPCTRPTSEHTCAISATGAISMIAVRNIFRAGSITDAQSTTPVLVNSVGRQQRQPSRRWPSVWDWCRAQPTIAARTVSSNTCRPRLPAASRPAALSSGSARTGDVRCTLGCPRRRSGGRRIGAPPFHLRTTSGSSKARIIPVLIPKSPGWGADVVSGWGRYSQQWRWIPPEVFLEPRRS